MRDPARIQRILKQIETLWAKYPDQRFGQTLINNGIIADNIQSWSLEDDDLEAHLKTIINKKEKKQK
jgi:hypothetical protein